MSNAAATTPKHSISPPTSVRHLVLAFATLMSVLLYLDRFAVGIAAVSIRADLRMNQTQIAWFISAFFWSYALCQVPAGWLSDRFGSRTMLTVYIVAWSLLTGLIGVAHAIWFMIWLRLLCGCAQAGAYPTAAGLIRRWYPISCRGMASSMVGLGGRFGAVLAPVLTAWLMVSLQTGGSGQGSGWRPAVIIYGIAGIVVATLFAFVVSDSPHQHLWCNPAEENLVSIGTSRRSASDELRKPSFPWRALLTDPSLWGNSLTQFLTNFGWFFVVSYLPRYLKEVHQVPLVMQGVMTAFPSGMGIFGLFAGGRCTDWAVRRFQLKWGRRIPLVTSRFTAAAGYAACLIFSVAIEPGPEKPWLPWLFIAGLCIAAASTDFGTPAIWAYAQDVGGPYTASILGWGNMWGNLGAAVAPLIYNQFLGEAPTIENWNFVFAACCGAFVLAGLSAMLLDSTKMITADGPIN